MGGVGIKRSSASVVRLSVCPSDVAYIGSNSITKRRRKTKLCTGVPQVTCDSHTDFKIKSQGHVVNFGGHVAAELSSAVTYLFFDVYVLRDIFLVKFYSIIIV